MGLLMAMRLFFRYKKTFCVILINHLIKYAFFVRKPFFFALTTITLTINVIFSKIKLCKLYNNKYMIASTQITNSEMFAFIGVLVLCY